MFLENVLMDVCLGFHLDNQGWNSHVWRVMFLILPCNRLHIRHAVTVLEEIITHQLIQRISR